MALDNGVCGQQRLWHLSCIWVTAIRAGEIQQWARFMIENPETPTGDPNCPEEVRRGKAHLAHDPAGGRCPRGH